MDASPDDDPPVAPAEDAMSSNEQDFVRRIRLGDAAAFETVFQTHFRVLYRLIYNVVFSKAVAEEILQDVFTSIWERRADWDVRGQLKSYLYRAARNRALDYARRERVQRRWQAMSTPDLPSRPVSVAADARVARDEFTAALARAIDRLPKRTQQAYVLRWQQDLSYTEIAQVMGISVKAVERHMTRALRLLRTALADFAPGT